MLVSDLLWALLGGTVVGIIGTWLATVSRDDVPLWLTVLLGVAGVVLGNTAYTRVFAATTPGVDWWRHTVQVAAAALLVALGARLSGRRRT